VNGNWRLKPHLRQGYQPSLRTPPVSSSLSTITQNAAANGAANPPIPVGLIAGWGRFPVLVAESLVRSGQPVVCVALKGLADPSLEYLCDHVQWFGVAKLGGHMRYFRRHGVQRVTMAGKLFKAELLFQRSVILSQWPDIESIKTFAPHFIWRREDTRDDSLLTAVTSAFARRSMDVIAATDFAPDLLASAGNLTKKKPNSAQLKDIRFGWSIAKTMGGMDIGQSITVRDGTVIAVEAVEGTDACITRSGQLCKKGGWTLIKVAKPNQDMRFDVPTIGPQTIQNVADAGGRAIAIEANMTILVDAEQCFKLADRLGITIVSLENNEMQTADVNQYANTDRTRNAA
jgi:UDP-2,3-diacylglucosamine hydrolase